MSYLLDIARRMTEYARRHPYHDNYPTKPYEKTLGGGLLLRLIYREPPQFERAEFELTLARAKVLPSATEIGTCRKYFFIPDRVPVRPFTGEDGWQGFRLMWIAEGEMQLEGSGEDGQ